MSFGAETLASFKANVRLTAGAGAPNAKGRASLKLAHQRGRHSERFTLVASKLPPNTAYRILADGVEVGTVTSNKHGGIVLRDLQTDLNTLQDVKLVTVSDGSEVLSAHF